jgi:hypothetical protein
MVRNVLPRRSSFCLAEGTVELVTNVPQRDLEAGSRVTVEGSVY